MATIQTSKQGAIEFRVLTDGYFAGRNDIEVAREAIQWWKVYLDKIDDTVRNNSGYIAGFKDEFSGNVSDMRTRSANGFVCYTPAP
jgi:hypothetical protein